MHAVSTPMAESLPEASFHAVEQPYIGQWNLLVSTTNWEKGRIIHLWREALVVAGAPSADYSDDAWSRHVGGVTGQHVGRLRRVFHRFGATHEQYKSLYWSHFQAAIDWEDAEMWLEGASRNGWSVADMARTRRETLGEVAADAAHDQEIIEAEQDEDYRPENEGKFSGRADYAGQGEVGPIAEGPDFGDESSPEQLDTADDFGGESPEAIPFVRPFEKLGELPPDFADAFEAFKLSILRHKSEDWMQIARDDVLGALDALKELALAPNGDDG